MIADTYSAQPNFWVSLSPRSPTPVLSPESNTSPSEALARASNKTTTEPIRDMYTLSLHRITLFKRGASFSEHSPLLYQLSTFPNWQKPHAGLRKMFMGEVAGKRVVVQGLWVGGWTWGPDVPHGGRREAGHAMEAGEERGSEGNGVGKTMGGPRDGLGHGAMPVTTAPWARTKPAGVA